MLLLFLLFGISQASYIDWLSENGVNTTYLKWENESLYYDGPTVEAFNISVPQNIMLNSTELQSKKNMTLTNTVDYVVHELVTNDYYKPYVDSIPKNLSTLPLVWSKEEKEMLSKTCMAPMLSSMEYHAHVLYESETFPINSTEFLRLYAFVVANTFEVNGHFVVYPLHTKFGYNTIITENGFESFNISRGDELLLVPPYDGPFGLLHHGVESDDYGCYQVAHLDPDDKDYYFKKSFINDQNHYVLHENDDFDHFGQVLMIHRLLVADHRDIEFLKELHEDIDLTHIPFLSRHNEMEAMQAMVFELSSEMESIPILDDHVHLEHSSIFKVIFDSERDTIHYYLRKLSMIENLMSHNSHNIITALKQALQTKGFLDYAFHLIDSL